MATARRIRPRSRAATPTTTSDAATPAALLGEQPAPVETLPHGIRLLARLPEVAPDKGGLWMERLEWLKRLDWNQVRRMRPDANWIAGGVLSLVLVLLLIITLHRGAKPAASSPETAAPAWTVSDPRTSLHDGPNAKSTSGTLTTADNELGSSTSAPVIANTAEQSSITKGMAAQPTAGSIAPAGAPENGGNLSLEGIYYPQTPYAAPIVMPTSPATPNQQANAGTTPGEIRTAQRDTSLGRTGAPVGFQSARPRLDGTISRPN
jgi:hypothetical protein